jgi:hypothetical protein
MGLPQQMLKKDLDVIFGVLMAKLTQVDYIVCCVGSLPFC